MSKPEIILPYSPGTQNADLKKANERLARSKSYQNLSTVIVTPTRGGRSLTPRWVSAMQGLIRPMNQMCFGPIFMSGMEVGAAFSAAVEMILANPQLSKAKFLLTVEDDTIPPPDGLLRLYESIGKYDIVAGLYFTKGPDGQPMLYGDPNVSPLNFIPQQVKIDQVQPVNGTGMGFSLIRMELFKKFQPPYFETKQSWEPNRGAQCYTQDLFFHEKVIRSGGKIAVDNRVKCAHHDVENDFLW